MSLNYSECRFLVTDFDACFRFFWDGLGLPVTWGAEGEGYASFDAGGPSVSIFSRTGMEEAVSWPGGLGGNGLMLALGADDLGAAAGRALAHGGTL
ncbi:MAG: VOC family protein, partial [Deinococcus sp.]